MKKTERKSIKNIFDEFEERKKNLFAERKKWQRSCLVRTLTRSLILFHYIFFCFIRFFPTVTVKLVFQHIINELHVFSAIEFEFLSSSDTDQNDQRAKQVKKCTEIFARTGKFLLWRARYVWCAYRKQLTAMGIVSVSWTSFQFLFSFWAMNCFDANEDNARDEHFRYTEQQKASKKCSSVEWTKEMVRHNKFSVRILVNAKVYSRQLKTTSIN